VNILTVQTSVQEIKVSTGFRPWLLRRDSSGASAHLVKELADEDSLSHKNHLRLTASKSEKLLSMVEGFNKEIRYYNCNGDFTEDRVGNNIKLATDLAGEKRVK
jgi:hypothetical protein